MIFNYDVSDLYEAIEDVKFNDVNIVTTASTDLDDYTTSGVYYFGSSYTPTNIPAGVNGWLLVFSGAESTVVKQLWFRHGTADSNDHHTYVRTLAGGTWATWKKLITSSDYAYASGDTFIASDSLTLDGFVSSSSEKIFFSVSVDKSLENISGVTVTALTGALRGSNGFIDSSSSINFISSSSYSVSATECSDRQVEITITKSSDFLNNSDSSSVTNNTLVAFHGTMTLTFT